MLPPDFTPQYSPIPPTGETICLAFAGDEILLTTGNKLPDTAQLAGLPAATTDCLIGEHGGVPCRLAAWPADIELPANLVRHNLRFTWELIDTAQYAIAVRAKLLLTWDREHRFCGACGTATEAMHGEPARVCPACQLRAYPRLSPAVMVLIHRGDELLLARSPHFRPGMYSALAGFVEAGESLEDCIHREVMEEVGVRVTNLRWFSSQPWPFPHSLMLAFHADYVDGEITPQPGEIEDARWFHWDALPEMPLSTSIAYRLLQSAIQEKNRP